jgi:hypothetical protein
MVLSGLQRAEGDGRWLTEQVDKPLPVLSLDLSYLRIAPAKAALRGVT